MLIVILSWLLIGSILTNIMWIYVDFSRKTRLATKIKHYIKGLLFGVFSGPFTALAVLVAKEKL